MAVGYGGYRLYKHIYPSDHQVGGAGNEDLHVTKVLDASNLTTSNKGPEPCGSSGGQAAQLELGSGGVGGSRVHVQQLSNTERPLTNVGHDSGGGFGNWGFNLI
jgi:hypothetical protein